MVIMKAKEAKNRFGLLLDTAQREPVSIEKHGRAVAVLLSRADYERLEALEDAYWIMRADAAAEEGFLGPEEGEAMMRELLRAED